MGPWRRRVRCLALSLLLIALPSVGHAQTCGGWSCPVPESVRWRVDARLAGVNAGIGAVTVALNAVLRHRPFSWKEVLLGATGGLVTFTGKRIAVERFDGSGFLGRQVAGVGSALVYNVGHGDEPFERLSFAFGPLRLRVARAEGAHLLVDAAPLIASAYFFLSGRAVRLDVARSLSSGALVLRMRQQSRPGRTLGSIILMPDAIETYDEALVVSHEAVHVLQADQVFWTLTADPDRWLARTLLPDAWADHVVLGLHVLMIGGAGQIIDYHGRPWEVEAYRITGE